MVGVPWASARLSDALGESAPSQRSVVGIGRLQERQLNARRHGVGDQDRHLQDHAEAEARIKPSAAAGAQQQRRCRISPEIADTEAQLA